MASVASYTWRSSYFGQVGGGDLAVGVAVVEPAQHPVERAVGEAFVGAQQPPADPVQGVVAVAALSERVLLNAAADLVEGLVGEANDLQHEGLGGPQGPAGP